MKIQPTKFMGFHGDFMDISWALYKGFYCSLSEAQRGAEDKGQIKAQLGGMPVRHVPLNENTPCQIHGVSWSFYGPIKPKANNVKLNDFI